MTTSVVGPKRVGAVIRHPMPENMRHGERRVEGDVALKQGPEPATVTPGDWLKPLPEEPMMDEEEVGLPFEGSVNGGLTRINGDNEPFYLIRPVDLQAV